MNAGVDQGLLRLASAVSARRLYGAEHRVVNEHVAGAMEALNAALAQDAMIAVHVVDGRVIGPEGTVSSSEEIRAGLFEPLGKKGWTSIKLKRGVTKAELLALTAIAIGENDDAETSASGRLEHIELGVAGVRERRAENSEGAEECQTTEELARAYRAIVAREDARAGEQADTKGIESIAAGICVAIAGARGTMLELASLKDYDEYTYVHTVNVAMLSAALAEAVGLSQELVHKITQGALMHDIGKRVVPMEILKKNGPLDDSERATMNRHPVEGARILIGNRKVPEVAPIIAFEHHMHLDGSGYPARARTWRPKLCSQIVQQADVFDALRTHRPYRAAMTTRKAVEILFEGSGTKYDSSLVEVFTQRVITRSGLGVADGGQGDKAAA